MCVIFASHKQVPTRHMAKTFRVHQLIDFLLENNPWYQHSGVSYSQTNMDSLFDAADKDVDCTVPLALQICHLPVDADQLTDIGDGVDEMANDGIRDTNSNKIVIEAVGYTKGDHSSATYVLDQKKFLLSCMGSQFIADNDPGLMSYFFYHSGRTHQQYLSMEAQVKNLLCQDDSPFQKDANFAFVVWNMIQKKEVSMNTCFARLKEIAPTLTNLVDQWGCSAKASTKFLRGSVGYKLCQRNEIPALMKKYCIPSIFVTVNPHDLTSSVIPVLVGIKLDD
ncbi:hypothetical protein F4604DRAFT_1883847 [Suillus subluteus]|nr:hypothetical protein F4604DRAFT_1883847 [Suillus subluteus]